MAKYLILGAGPAGLALGNRLMQLGEGDFLILEKEREAGGLCRSALVDGAPFDIGGGHFLDVSRPRVTAFLFGFMPESEWNLFDRDSRIRLGDALIGHPLEANIWQLPEEVQIQYLKSIAVAGCNLNQPKPELFFDWIYWKLGAKIADDYMIPYNQKMFGDDLNQLGTYWLEKLPSVSFDETLLSCLRRQPFGQQPGHAHFYYPKEYGYGELWRRLAQALDGHIAYGASVSGVDFKGQSVLTSIGEYAYDAALITTIPWNAMERVNGMPKALSDGISRLKSTSIVTEYSDKALDTKAHWVYDPNRDVPYHRILARQNFCPGSRGYWTETNHMRWRDTGAVHFVNPYAYPLNTVDKPAIMADLIAWARSVNVYGLGRWGEHSHHNSDVVVDKAMHLAERLALGSAHEQ